MAGGVLIPLDSFKGDFVERLTAGAGLSLREYEPVALAMQGMRRVLKPGGKLIFSEHGRAPDAAINKWQDRLNGVWGHIAGGCNINRDIPHLIEQGGFKITDMDQMYVPSTPRVLGYTYWGAAEIR